MNKNNIWLNIYKKTWSRFCQNEIANCCRLSLCESDLLQALHQSRRWWRTCRKWTRKTGSLLHRQSTQIRKRSTVKRRKETRQEKVVFKKRFRRRIFWRFRRWRYRRWIVERRRTSTRNDVHQSRRSARVSWLSKKETEKEKLESKKTAEEDGKRLRLNVDVVWYSSINDVQRRIGKRRNDGRRSNGRTVSASDKSQSGIWASRTFRVGRRGTSQRL